MTQPWRTVGAGASLAGGLLLFLGSLPPAWFGYEPGDSYIFDPAVLSPIWIERVLLPALIGLGSIGLLGGIMGLLYRDWHASRLVRWAGVTTLVGGLAFLVGIYGPDFFGPAGGPVSPVLELAGFGVATWGLLLVLVGGPLLAVAYLRLDKRRLGWSFVVFVPAGLLLGWLVPGGVGDLAGSVPYLFFATVVGWDLLALGAATGESSN